LRMCMELTSVRIFMDRLPETNSPRCAFWRFAVILSKSGQSFRILRHNRAQLIPTCCFESSEASTPQCREGILNTGSASPDALRQERGPPKGGLDETFGKALIVWNRTVLHSRAGAPGVSANSPHNPATPAAKPAGTPQGQWRGKRCRNWCYDGWQRCQG